MRLTTTALLSALSLLLMPPPHIGAALVSMPPDGAPAKVTAYMVQPARRMKVLATSYCLSGTTATGTRVAPGTIAVDPRLIPLRARLWVQGYGVGRALDTGSAIIGKHIDVWLPNCAASWKWGRRTVAIEILGTPRLSRHVPPRLHVFVR